MLMTRSSAPYILAGNKTFCNYCPGYCCYRLKGATLYLDAIDINRMARHFSLSDGEIRKRYLEDKNTFKTREDGSCIFLSNDRMYGRCSIHPARPKQCREFPYDDPCPYLESDDLLRVIQTKVEKSLASLPLIAEPEST
jgi:Fe-S-cluster containining protein